MYFNKKAFTLIEPYTTPSTWQSSSKSKAFTLIELLIVIGIIAILASAVIVAINPGRQFAAARDATRESHLNTLNNALLSYQTANQGGWGDLSTEITTDFTEICNTNLETPDCTDLADLSAITPDHINQIPVDPQGSVSETADGTGYFIAEGSVMLVAENAETRFIGVGITEGEFTESGNGEEDGNGEEFTCGDTFTDSRDSQTYATVEIGDQCWFAEDLRYDCSDAGYNNIGESESWSSDGNCGEVPGYDNIHYQWDVAMDGSTIEGVQGLCPDGWIIPSDDDFKTLEMHLGMSQTDADSMEWRGDQEGDMLKSDPEVEDWCNNSTNCATSGWGGLPGGDRDTGGALRDAGSRGVWWSSSSGTTYAVFRQLSSSQSEAYRFDYSKSLGNSVRCLRNE